MGGRSGSGGGKGFGGIAPRDVSGSSLPKVYQRKYGKDATFKVEKVSEFGYRVSVKPKGGNWTDPLGGGDYRLTEKQTKAYVGFLKGVGYKMSK